MIEDGHIQFFLDAAGERWVLTGSLWLPLGAKVELSGRGSLPGTWRVTGWVKVEIFHNRGDYHWEDYPEPPEWALEKILAMDLPDTARLFRVEHCPWEPAG